MEKIKEQGSGEARVDAQQGRQPALYALKFRSFNTLVIVLDLHISYDRLKADLWNHEEFIIHAKMGWKITYYLILLPQHCNVADKLRLLQLAACHSQGLPLRRNTSSPVNLAQFPSGITLMLVKQHLRYARMAIWEIDAQCLNIPLCQPILPHTGILGIVLFDSNRAHFSSRHAVGLAASASPTQWAPARQKASASEKAAQRKGQHSEEAAQRRGGGLGEAIPGPVFMLAEV
ncbi:hypothetical protein B0H11DRAFT_1941159 [Mycena galericulata]|nr:hypothetical protein B0H11DRAFT_1941159 [Mycena galericulata]